MDINKTITKNLLDELFVYSEGHLYWKVSPAKRVKIGNRAGRVSSLGYTHISIKNIRYSAHRLIFLMHHGFLPEVVDHIDGNPKNNKIENLRACNFAQNSHNAKLYATNTSGTKGVSWHKASKKWIVQVRVNKKPKHFGIFDDLELAELVANEARHKFHGEFARFN